MTDHADEIRAALYRIETEQKEVSRKLDYALERTTRLEEQRDADRERLVDAAKDRGRIEGRVALVDGRVQALESKVDQQVGASQVDRLKRVGIDGTAVAGGAAGLGALIWRLMELFQHQPPPGQ